MTTVTFLSPHSDDVGWSIGSLVSKLGSRSRAELVTLFSVCNYTPTLGKLTTDEATKVRTAEDMEFCSRVGIKYASLHFAEGLLRGYPDIESLFRFQESDADPIYTTIREAVMTYADRHRSELVFSPLALGYHIDHLICRDVALETWSSTNLLFYEDLPYAGFLSYEEINSQINQGIGMELHQLQLPGCSRIKHDLASVYRSQFRDEVWQPICRHANRLSQERMTERIWGAKEPLRRMCELIAE